jgi:hypothetical protein
MQLAVRDALFELPIGYTAGLPARLAELSVGRGPRRRQPPPRSVAPDHGRGHDRGRGAAIGATRVVAFDAY